MAHDEVVDALRFGRGDVAVVVVVVGRRRGEGRIHVLLESPEKRIRINKKYI